jgi:hypothetical protein
MWPRKSVLVSVIAVVGSGLILGLAMTGAEACAGADRGAAQAAANLIKVGGDYPRYSGFGFRSHR